MVTLTGTFTRLDGTPATGTVRVTPSRSPIMDPDGKIVISGPQEFPLDKDGKLTTEIPASDDPDLGPPFTYSVAVNLAHASWKISKVWIPHGSTTVDLSEIGDYTPLPGEPTRTVTVPADGEDGQVLVWDGAGFVWDSLLTEADLIELENAAQQATDATNAAITAASQIDTKLAGVPRDQADLAQLVRDQAAHYTNRRFVKSRPDSYHIRYDDGHNGVLYEMVKDTNDDFHKINSCWTGYGETENAVMLEQSDLTGVWNTATGNWYTQEPGATFSTAVTGSSIDLLVGQQTNGGVWSVVVDDLPPVTASCWAPATGPSQIITVATGLNPDATHTVTATFIGDDPDNPAPGGSRGYIRNTAPGSVYGRAGSATPVNQVLADGSNKELAFTLSTPQGHAWVPDHGVGTAFYINPITVHVDGQRTDVGSMAVGDSIPFTDSVEIRQHFAGHVEGSDRAEFWTKHTFTADGRIIFDGRLTALEQIGVTGYPLMLPAGTAMDTFLTGLGNTQNRTGTDAEVPFPEEEDSVYSGALLSSTNHDLVAAGTLKNGRLSMRRGQGSNRPFDDRLFVWQRTSKPKMYWSAAKGWQMSAGQTYFWGFEMLVAEVPNVFGALVTPA